MTLVGHGITTSVKLLPDIITHMHGIHHMHGNTHVHGNSNMHGNTHMHAVECAAAAYKCSATGGGTVVCALQSRQQISLKGNALWPFYLCTSVLHMTVATLHHGQHASQHDDCMTLQCDLVMITTTATSVVMVIMDYHGSSGMHVAEQKLHVMREKQATRRQQPHPLDHGRPELLPLLQFLLGAHSH